ncbi:MAG: NUDIX domain-containing protein [Bdellovibrionales bacterium]|nr:NUDIX domain-containing protein [Ramlibacter sp.]
MLEGLDPHWHAALSAGARLEPLRPRIALRSGDAVFGSVEAGVLERIAPLRLANGSPATELAGGDSWQVHGELTASLALIANALRSAGLAHAWRDEQLAVTDAQARCLGTVERAVVRVLGIATHAVHLVGLSPEGGAWVQQRALNKANDPGLWDTLMGGMVPAADSVETALARETWEEAGLVVSALNQLSPGGRITINKPCADGGGTGYMNEQIDWYRAVVPHGMTPVNQDGEVRRFELLDRAALRERLYRNAFTQEAALILCAAL